MKKNRNLYLCIAMLVLVIVFAREIDLAIGRVFYNQGLFYLHDGFWAWMVKFGFPALLVLSGLTVFGLWAWGWKHEKKWIWGVNTEVMFFITGSMLVLVGVVVNGIFKTFWGRARPQDIVEFGGDKLFSLPFVISNQCGYDCSFMSGHAAIGFWVVCFGFLAPMQYRRYAIGAALLFGSLLGLARIAEGLHFFTDILFAGLLVVGGVWWMHKKMIK